MKKIIPLLLLVFMLGLETKAQEVTYSEHIASIIYDNCTSCHRPGEIAPFALTNYEEVSAWGATIQYVTEIKYMPPWKPDPDYSNFVGERRLSDEDIQLIADWVEAGTPQGNPDLEPPLPNFTEGSQLGEPDLVLEMAEDYHIAGNNIDDYRVFVLPTGLTDDKEIAAIEFRAGNTKAVHHALLAYETLGAAAAMDAESPEYGYEAFGGFGVATQGNFTGYTPGISNIFYPEGIGKTLPAGADILIQVHYAPLPSDETDRSSLNIFFKDEADPISREVERLPFTPLDLDGGFFSFFIPPNEVKTFHGTKQITEDISLISIYPHCHYLGQGWEIYAVTPTDDTINIISIPEWDFNWQGEYTLERMKKIPSGSIIHAYSTYDNTTNNPFNPNNPPELVRWGEGTGDEMFLSGLSYVPYLAGDEDIVIGGDMTTSTDELTEEESYQLSAPFPNPTSGEVTLAFSLPNGQPISIELFDLKGSLVQTIIPRSVYLPGQHQITFTTQALPEGLYSIRIRTTETVASRRMVVMK